MKIGLVCRQFLSNKGGMEKYTLSLSAELARLGHEVHVFANTGEETPDVQLHHVPFIPFSSPAKNLSFALMAAKQIARFQLDVVQSMERIWQQDIFRASDGINPVQMEQRYPNPVLRKFKAITPRRQVLGFLEKQIFEKNGTRFVLTNSNLVKEQIRNHYHIPDEKVHVIYNGVDTGRYNLTARDRFGEALRMQYGIKPDMLSVLFVGNEFKLKGLPALIEAAAGIGPEKVRVMVVGADPVAPYQRWAQKIGIGDAILFLGYQKNLERIYGAADLLVLPTRYDPFANVCLEAMACGTPVITTRMNGACEIIENGREGFVLKTGGADELSARIQHFLAAPDRMAMTQRVAEKAAGFTMENHIRRLFDLYARVSEEKANAYRYRKNTH